MGSANRALASASRVLLGPWLCTTPRHLRSCLGTGRALPGIGLLTHRHLMYQRRVHGSVEDIVPYIHLANGLALEVVKSQLHGLPSPSLSLVYKEK